MYFFSDSFPLQVIKKIGYSYLCYILGLCWFSILHIVVSHIWRRACNPLQYCCLENPYGQRSLIGYSPWGCKESDTTKGLSIAQPSVSYSSVYSWTLTKTILNKTQVKKEAKTDIIDYLAISRPHKNLLNLVKALFRQKCIILNFLLGKKIKAKHKVVKHLSP